MGDLLIKKLRPDAKIPVRATDGSAGLDLCACVERSVVVPGGGHALIPTGIAVALPDSASAAFVFARSGLAIKHGIGLLNGVGVVDSDYRGEICVGLVNLFESEYTIEPGERIAQLVILPVALPAVREVDSLDETERGAGGFGSTGKT